MNINKCKLTKFILIKKNDHYKSVIFIEEIVKKNHKTNLVTKSIIYQQKVLYIKFNMWS